MMKALQLKAARGLLSQVGGMLGFDPLAAWRECDPSTRAGGLALLELASSSAAMLPPSPPAELAQLIERAAAEHSLPADLLVAMSWELARYGAEPQLQGTVGPMALPAAFARAQLEDQVRGAAAGLAIRASQGGLGAALVAYCGSIELARAVVGTFVLFTVARLQVPADAHQAVIGILEGVTA